ncbi:MAG: hypothetical protein K2O12_00190, partial [Muribaculaceae bacterium]|nr:hypothetical protein [Muribaculaceae bacterium]
WLPTHDYSFKNGKAKILYGVDKGKSYIYAFISDSEGNEDHKQFYASSGYNTLSLSPLSKTAEKTYLTLVTIRDCTIKEEHVVINNPEASRAINVKIESFRDRLIPGEQENWKISTVDAHGKPVQSALLLDVYNLALDKVHAQSFMPPFFNIPQLGGYYFAFGMPDNTITHICQSKLTLLPTSKVENPSFNDYGLEFGFNTMQKLEARIFVRGSKAKLSEDNVMDFSDDAVLMESSVTAASYASGASSYEEKSTYEPDESSNKPETTTYRPSEMPLMMFRPMLTTDTEGNYSLSFTVPDANATWRMALVAFTNDLQTAGLQKDFITSKPIMVAPNAPRFLRAGDTAKIISSVMNATDSVADIEATIEIFNPLTGEILKSEIKTLSIKAG